MKTFGIIVFLGILICSCSSQKNLTRLSSTKHLVISDSTQYELLVSDPEFESWFLTNASPANDHSNEYYQNWNNQYVIDWNYHYTLGHRPRVFENYIDYDNSVNYGIEVNRKLYYYFRFVESYLKIPILVNGKKNTT